MQTIMELVFCCEAVFQHCNQVYYSSTAPFGMSLWERYLNVYDHIVLIARVEDTCNPTKYELNGEKITVIPLPRYKGLIGTLKAIRKLKKVLYPQALNGRAYILRVPGQIGSTFVSILNKNKIPFGVEVVGDPWDVMDSIGGRLSLLLKYVGRYQLRRAVEKASAVLYVTKYQLQKRYPARAVVRSYVASNVKIKKDFFSKIAKKYPDSKDTFGLMAVGSLEQLYKAPDIVITAIAMLGYKNIKVRLHWVGGGRYQQVMEKLAKEMGVDDNIRFYGNVGKDIIEVMLEKMDLFIHVSRTEGLPRAIIEAMAKGLPVIGSNVGGIPELLSDEVIVHANDVDGLVDKIKQLINNPDFYNAQSKRNLLESRQYEDSILSNIRSEFYNHVKSISVK